MKQGQVRLCGKLGYKNASLQLHKAVNWVGYREIIQTWIPETHPSSDA